MKESLQCHKHAVYGKRCAKCIPPPLAPFMRIGERGETVNPETGERIAPPTTQWNRAPKGVCNICFFSIGLFVGCLLTLLLSGWR